MDKQWNHLLGLNEVLLHVDIFHSVDYLRNPCWIEAGEPLMLIAACDSYSMWFSVLKKAAER